MRLTYLQLSTHLQKNLLPIYLITGSEYFLIDEARTALCLKAKQLQFLEPQTYEANKDFDWYKLLETCNTPSLFNEKSLVEIKLNHKPSASSSKDFVYFLENLPPTVQLIISCSKLDSDGQKSNWIKTIDTLGAIVTIWPFDQQQSRKWLEQRLHQLNLNCDLAAIDYLLHSNEGNLLALAQELEKLKLLFDNQTITLEKMTTAIGDNARYDLFNFIDIILEGDGKKIKRILNKLKLEGVELVLLLWGVTREIRNLLNILADLDNKVNWQLIVKKYKIWDKRQPLIKRAIKLHSPKNLHQLLLYAEKIDHTIKGIEHGNAWQTMETIAFVLAGIWPVTWMEHFISSPTYGRV
jgi:DNA polymerase-3 subunit delta